MLYFIYDQCKHSASLVTETLAFEFIAHGSNVKKTSVKTTLQRLHHKAFVNRIDYKDGRGGWVIYEIEKDIYQHLIHEETRHKPNTNSTHTKYKFNTQPDTQPNTSASSSSGKDLLSTTTTRDLEISALPPEWEEIDLSELQKRGINFGKPQLLSNWQFLKNHSAFEFQESIDGFVYDIENNHVHARRGYLNLFIGTIRNGQLYISSHYVSPERKKINEMIELNKKRKAELESVRQEVEEARFVEWMNDYGIENIKKQLPVNLLVDFEHQGKSSLGWVRQHIYRKVEE